MKKTGLFAFLALLTAALCLLSSCAANTPPVEKIEKNELSDFGNYNSFVEEHLKEKTVLFPGQGTVGNVVNYRYRYECAALGDPVFLVEATVLYDKSSFETELLRIQNTAFASKTTSNKGFVYLGNDVKYINEFFEETVLDGLPFCFDIAEADEEDLQITYFAALCWDQSHKDGFLIKAAETARDVLQAKRD